MDAADGSARAPVADGGRSGVAALVLVQGVVFAFAGIELVGIAAGETQTYSFNNFGYYQSYDKGTYPSMPEQFSFLLAAFREQRLAPA